MQKLSTEILYGKESRIKLQEGVDALANAVKVTLGPKGRNVIIEQHSKTKPHVTKDGVTVANSIYLEDSTANMGVELIRSVATMTADNAGDGTSTSIVIAQAIVNKGMEALNDSTVNGIELKKGIDKGLEFVLEHIKTNAKKLDSLEEIKAVALISANGDEEITNLVVEAMQATGVDGIVTVEESNTVNSYVESIQGYQINNGWGNTSKYFVGDNVEKVLIKPYILLVNSKIIAFKEIQKVLENCVREKRQLLIVTENVEGEALSSLLANVIRKTVDVIAVRAYGTSATRKDFLEDLAIFVEGKVVNESADTIKLEHLGKDNFFGKEYLGTCDKVIVAENTTTFIGGKGNTKERINYLKNLISMNTGSAADLTLRKERLAKLASSVSIIYLGAYSQVELKEKQDRLDDALQATKAAMLEGIVEGGGLCLLKAAKLLEAQGSVKNSNLNLGIKILIESIQEPFRMILTNAGVDWQDVEKEFLSSGKSYNPRTEEYENFLDSKIIDPAKVTRLAISNAASIAGTLLTTETSIIYND